MKVKLNKSKETVSISFPKDIIQKYNLRNKNEIEIMEESGKIIIAPSSDIEKAYKKGSKKYYNAMRELSKS